MTIELNIGSFVAGIVATIIVMIIIDYIRIKRREDEE